MVAIALINALHKKERIHELDNWLRLLRINNLAIKRHTFLEIFRTFLGDYPDEFLGEFSGLL